jgi:ankyrin repeat protein
MAQKTKAGEKEVVFPDARMGPHKPTAERARKILSLDEQDRIDKQFFDIIKGGKRDELASQIEKLERAGIDIGPVINATEMKIMGATLLVVAAARGFAHICELLIEKGAYINMRDRSGNTALMYAASSGRTETCKLLIEKGADVNARGEFERTALIIAAEHGHVEICRLLVSKGAYVSEENSAHMTAAEVAEKNNHKETAAFLASVESKKAV